MYLVLGEPNRQVVEAFTATLQQRNRPVLFLKELTSELDFIWSFNTNQSSSALSIDGHNIDSNAIRGVLVQNPLLLDSEPPPEDAVQYAQAEKNAILFAWFSSLVCPVINRYPVEYWFSPGVALPFWEKWIRDSGLEIAPAILSNVEAAIKKFGEALGTGASYLPFCGSEAYRASTKEDWKGIAKLAAICPVNLTWFIPPLYAGCVVGKRVFWNRHVSKAISQCERQLVEISRAAHLDFVEFHLATNKDLVYVHRVDPFPKLEPFDGKLRRLIAEELVKYLDSGARS
jgi:hypothetical protein